MYDVEVQVLETQAQAKRFKEELETDCVKEHSVRIRNIECEIARRNLECIDRLKTSNGTYKSKLFDEIIETNLKVLINK